VALGSCASGGMPDIGYETSGKTYSTYLGEYITIELAHRSDSRDRL
jgi:hypothetical protein